jgi:hypothetical protein
MFHPQEIGEFHSFKTDDSQQLRREEIEAKTRLITSNNSSFVSNWVPAEGKKQLQRMMTQNSTVPLLGPQPMSRLTKFIGEKMDEWIQKETFAGIAKVRPQANKKQKPSTKTEGKDE